MEFPADLIPLLTSFLDPPSLATMAQTCRAWKTLVYRTSVWKPFLWKPKPAYAALFRVRNESVHLGEPHALCFLDWAWRLFQEDTLPLVEEKEPIGKYVRKLYKRWKSEKRPCSHISHHEWSSVFLCSTMTPAERLELQTQVCEQWFSLHGENPYKAWLRSQKDAFASSLQYMRQLSREPPPLVNYTLLAKKESLHNWRRWVIQKEMASMGNRIYYRLTDTCEYFRNRTCREFDANEALAKGLWDAAAFTFTKAEAKAKTATHNTTRPSGEPESSTRPA
jgi:hypothetical protein